MSPASNLEMQSSRDSCRALLILWQSRRFRSIERPSSWTWRCFRIVSYRFGGGLKLAFPSFDFWNNNFTWQCLFPGFGIADGNLCPGWCSLPGACNTHTPENILGDSFHMEKIFIHPICGLDQIRSECAFVMQWGIFTDIGAGHWKYVLHPPVHSAWRQTDQSRGSPLPPLRQREIVSWIKIRLWTCHQGVCHLNTVKAWNAESL